MDSAKVAIYNKDSINKFTVTKSKTSFPSELEITQEGQVMTYGGLVLVKLTLHDKTKNTFEGIVNLKYTTGNG